MELINMDREKLEGLKCALPMTAHDSDLSEIAAQFPTAVYVNRSTWNVLTDHTRKAALATQKPTIPVILVEIDADEELAAAIAYSGGIDGNLSGKPASYEDSLTLARYAWKLFQAGKRGREILLTMGQSPEYWLNLFDYLKEPNAPDETPQTDEQIAPYSKNLDIPNLDPIGQARREDVLDGIGLEFIAWGTQARNKPLKATHFYTDDSRWKGIESKPDYLKQAGVSIAIEANYSTNEDMPRILVLADIYKKRRLSADWIRDGIKLFVDLNIAEPFLEDAFLGVPKTWKAYANRYYANDTAHLFKAFEAAKAHAGEDVLYLVYGTEGAKELCKANNWLFVDSIVSTGWGNGTAQAQA